MKIACRWINRTVMTKQITDDWRLLDIAISPFNLFRIAQTRLLPQDRSWELLLHQETVDLMDGCFQKRATDSIDVSEIASHVINPIAMQEGLVRQ